MGRFRGLAMWGGRLGRLALGIVIVFVVTPYLLTPLYRVVEPTSTLMVWRWITGARVERTIVSIERIAPVLPRTVIAAEDARFCSHHGIDWQGIRTAMEDAEEFDDLRGGSTITQQTVKNLFLWPGRSVVRKALEIPLALWMDLIVPKRRIMEIYLNIAEWGPTGEFGAEAGARRAFGKSASEIGPGEAGLMAAILPNPIRRSARQPSRSVQRLAGIYRARAARTPLDGCLRR